MKFQARAVLSIRGPMLAALACTVPAGAQQAPIVIPLHVDHSPYRVPHLGIDVTIGSVTKRLEVDTSSPGLRILANALPSGAWQRTGQTVTGDFGNGLNLRGFEGSAPLTLAGLHSDHPVQIEAVESIACASWDPKCPAAKGGVPDEFGRVFPGVLGLKVTNSTPDGCCVNPLLALAGRVGHAYVLHADFAKPTITLSPDASTTNKFTTAPLSASSWPTGCIAVKDVALQVCGEVVVDTDSQHTLILDPAPTFQGFFPQGTVANVTIGPWKHNLTSGGDGDERYSIVSQRGDKKLIVIGLGPLQDVDVLFDLDRNRIGFLGL